MDHYIREGVEHFYLTDNGSTDAYQDIITPYIEKGLITLVVDDRKYIQSEVYIKTSKIITEYEWVIVCDMDEFIYARNGFKTISSYLKTLPLDVSQVHVNFKIFGSNGHIKQTESVVPFFTKRNSKISKYLKSIYRSSSIVSPSIHGHKTKGKHIMSNGDKCECGNGSYSCCTIDSTKIDNYILHCNHYPIQSYEWFMNVKAKRQSAYAKKHNGKNYNYFVRLDVNEIEDTELLNKTY